MPKRLLFSILVMVAPASVGAQVVAEMTPELVKQAIADTKNDGCYDLRKGFACFTTPYSRVALAAQAARKKYQTFTEKDATSEMIAPIVEILAEPQPSFVYGRGRVGPPIDVSAVIVIPAKSKDPSGAIQPSDTGPLDEHYQNMMGAHWEAKGLVARFPLAVVTEANEVRVVYDGKGCIDWKMKYSTECTFKFDLKGVK
jgi:hypothetical protein